MPSSPPAWQRAAVGLRGVPVRAGTPEDAAETLCAALRAVKASGHRVTSAEEARDLAVQLCGGRPAVIEDHPDLARLAPLASLLQVVSDPWTAAIGVTGVEMAVAETGTLVLIAGQGRPRSTSLVPPEHLALVPLSRLVATYAEAIERLGYLDSAPSGISLVSGISRSGDIEHRTVYGVHGPGKVDVIIYPD